MWQMERKQSSCSQALSSRWVSRWIDESSIHTTFLWFNFQAGTGIVYHPLSLISICFLILIDFHLIFLLSFSSNFLCLLWFPFGFHRHAAVQPCCAEQQFYKGYMSSRWSGFTSLHKRRTIQWCHKNVWSLCPPLCLAESFVSQQVE